VKTIQKVDVDKKAVLLLLVRFFVWLKVV